MIKLIFLKEDNRLHLLPFLLWPLHDKIQSCWLKRHYHSLNKAHLHTQPKKKKYSQISGSFIDFYVQKNEDIVTLFQKDIDRMGARLLWLLVAWVTETLSGINFHEGFVLLNPLQVIRKSHKENLQNEAFFLIQEFLLW